MEGETSKTYVFGQDGTGMNSPWPWLAMGGGNGFGGFGMNGIVDLFGLAIIASIFGWNGNGFGGFGGNGNAAAGYISNQLNNDSGRELLMNAITSQGEQSRAAIQTLSTMLGQDFNLVNSAVQNLQNGISQLAASQGMSTLQVINAIQSGNASLQSQLAQCCCENRLLTTEQGYQAQLRTLEQTNHLGSQADRNAAAITGAIKDQSAMIVEQFCQAKERDMQSQIDKQAETISILRGQIDNAAQTQQILGAVNGLIAPLQKQVSEIAAKQPNTVPVTWPNLVAVNSTPYMGGFNPYGYGANGSSYWG